MKKTYFRIFILIATITFSSCIVYIPKEYFDNYKLIRERQKKFWLELNYKKHILTYLDKIKKDDAYLYNLYLELKKKKRYKRLGI